MKIAQFSDLHYSNPNLAEVDRCFAYAVSQAIATGVNAAVISGDSTDHGASLCDASISRSTSERVSIPTRRPAWSTTGSRFRSRSIMIVVASRIRAACDIVTTGVVIISLAT